MKLTISNTAKDYLGEKITNKTFILALNDGSNQFSTVGGSCAVGDKFQIIPTVKSTSDYSIVLPNPTFTVYISNLEKTFLGNDITIDFNLRTYSLILKNESGILDANVFFCSKN
ncbi:iron-sulfur cluster biosynthesis family protein [Enterococcus faecium]|nr:iron-sulfur cluster biosynthesis family protein [Enterococcus faecium]